MSTKFPELFMALGRDFHPDEIKTRPQGAGERGQRFQIRYVTARTVMNRLDEVLGPENWWDSYSSASDTSVVCHLSIRLPDGTVITKCDAGGNAGMADAGDDDKSGYSDALKRAAVKFLIGRYLYNDGVPYLDGAGPPQQQPQPQTRQPARPEPLRLVKPEPQRATANGRQSLNNPGYPNLAWPKAGTKQVFAFLKALEEVTGESVLTGVGRYAKEQGWDWKKETWTQDQVDQVLLEAIEQLKQSPSYNGSLDQLTNPTTPTTSSPLAQARKALVEAAVAQLQDMGYEGTPDEIRQLLESLSPGVTNGKGHKGTVMESIRNCNDLVWLQNMTAEVQRGAHTAVPPQDDSQEGQEDVPF